MPDGSKPNMKVETPLWLLPLLAMIAHVVCINNYGFFRDELYYLSCTHRLAWGYVDHPPFCVFLLRVVTVMFGESLAAIRIPTVIASGMTVFLTMAISRKLGAGRLGVWLTGLATLLSGMNLVLFSFYSMNPLEVLIWATAAYLVVCLVQTPSPWQWMALGAVMGIGLLNKSSAAWLVVGLYSGLALSPRRRLLASIWPWMGLALACAMTIPFIQWQALHGWPTKEFASNALREKMLPVPPWMFLLQQAVVINVAAVPFVVAGLCHGFRKTSREWLPLSFVFGFVLALLIFVGKSRVNYLAPAYSFVIPLGAVIIENWIKERNPKFGLAHALALVVCSLPSLVFGLPWMDPRSLTSLLEKVPIQPPQEEAGEKSLMQGWADMFGWGELASEVERAVQSLPDSERANVVVVARNYGEAAALERFTSLKVLCGHNNFWYWGPGDWDGKTAIFVNRWPEATRSMFTEFRQIGAVDAPYAVPEQNGSPIWVARGLKLPIHTFWHSIKSFR